MIRPRSAFLSARLGVAAALVLACAAVAATPVAPAHGVDALGPRSQAADIREALSLAVTKAQRHQPKPRGLNYKRQSRDIWFKHFRCSAWWDESKARMCPMGDVGAKKTVVLAGDSHAGMWLYSLDELGKQQGFKVIPLLKHACSPYYYPQTLGGAKYSACTKFRKWTRSRIKALRPAAVILGSRGFLEVRPPRGSSVTKAWSAGVRASVRSLRPYTRRVITMSDLPTRRHDIVSCVRRSSHLGTCLTKARGSRETRSNAPTQRAARSAGGEYVNLVPLVCQRDRCPALVGKTFTYFDDDHLSMSWSKVLVRAFGTRVGPLVPSPQSVPRPIATQP